MGKRNGKQKLNNSGLTLIELIVTIAIIGIFSGVIVTYITSGSSLYRNTSNAVKIQTEAQETFDRLEDIIVNANRTISYDATGHVFNTDSYDKKLSGADEDGSSSDNTEDNVVNVRDTITWDQTTKELSYIRYEKSQSGWTSSDPEILATDVTYFNVDTGKISSDNIVSFTLRIKKGTKEIETMHSVGLRNSLKSESAAG